MILCRCLVPVEVSDKRGLYMVKFMFLTICSTFWGTHTNTIRTFLGYECPRYYGDVSKYRVHVNTHVMARTTGDFSSDRSDDDKLRNRGGAISAGQGERHCRSEQDCWLIIWGNRIISDKQCSLGLLFTPTYSPQVFLLLQLSMFSLRKLQAYVLGRQAGTEEVCGQLRASYVPVSSADCRSCSDPCDLGMEGVLSDKVFWLLFHRSWHISKSVSSRLGDTNAWFCASI